MSFFTQIAKITDYLYLSGCSAVKPDRLRQLGITYVINCTIEVPNLNVPDIEVTKIQVDDMPNSRLSVYFDRCADKIKQVRDRGGRTLVHCVAGVSRSSSICLAFLMKYLKMNLRESYNFVKSKRPIIRPNAGFFRQLIEYEKKLFGKNSVTMINSGVGSIPDVYKEEVKGMVWMPSHAGFRY